MAALVGCGSSSTEPHPIAGSFTLTSVNGVTAAAPFDASNCSTVYEGVTFVQLTASGAVTMHARTHPNCSTNENVYDDGGTYTVHGSALTLRLSRQSVDFTGTVSADQNTLTLDMRDVWHPDATLTARFVFTRF